MSKRTLFLIFALFVITLVLLMLALYKPSPPETTTVVTVPKEPIEQSILFFGNPVIATSSSVSTLNYSLPIQIATGKNKVTTVQLELQYDPEILTDVSIIPGSFFANPQVLLQEIDPKTGRISYAFGAGLTGQGVVGLGTVATLNFSAKATPAQPTTILFLPKTLVAAEGVSKSALKQSNNIELTVGKINSTPSAPPAGGPNQ